MNTITYIRENCHPSMNLIREGIATYNSQKLRVICIIRSCITIPDYNHPTETVTELILLFTAIRHSTPIHILTLPLETKPRRLPKLAVIMSMASKYARFQTNKSPREATWSMEWRRLASAVLTRRASCTGQTPVQGNPPK